MSITAAMVKELRDRTDLPMMKCKEALSATDGDLDAAVEFLRKQGLQAAGKKAGRETKTGGLGVAVEGGKGTIVLVACETDFVAKNDDFRAFTERLAQVALRSGADSPDALAGQQLDGLAVKDALSQLIAKIGENMQIAAVQHLAGGVVAGYNHGGRVATMVAGSGDGEVLRKIAMHIAAANPAPIALARAGVPQDLLDKEREIIGASKEVQAKPEQIRPKIVEGKLNRFYKEHVLLEQEMLVENDDGSTVEKWAKARGAGVSGFARLSV